MRQFNHKIRSNTINYTCWSDKRGRLRVPSSACRHAGFKPGDRVKLFLDSAKIQWTIAIDPNGRYKVEKDGAIRLGKQCSRFGDENGIYMTSDSCSNSIGIL